VKPLRRARLILVGAFVFFVALVATSFPAGVIVRQRVVLAAVDRQLVAVDVHNAALSSQIASLQQPSTIEAIAREDYGLVRPGQLSYVILPGKGAHAVGAGTLGVEPIPVDDLVPTGVSALAIPEPRLPKSPSLWSRTLRELEFWRWAL
jgi:cell division protein FtsB